MKPPQNAFFGCGLVVLYENLIDAGFLVIVVVISLHEVTAGVAEHLRGDHLKTFDMTCFY